MVAVRLERVERLTPAVSAAAAALAWVMLLVFFTGSEGSHGHGFAAAFVMWNVMMVAMMLPSLLPWLALFDPPRAARFALGYFAVWAVYCLAAATAQISLQGELAVSGRAAGAILIAAGAFQFTPLKQSCLRKCRSPLGHLLTHWKSGRGFAFRVGMAHGVNCLGCCWALMAVAFALGVMNLWWMAALTVLIVFEKLLPRGELFSRWIGAALFAGGALWLLVA